MTEAQAVEAVYAMFETGWETLHPGSTTPADTAQPLCVPWTGRNEEFSTAQLGALQAWARIAIRHAVSSQRTMGPVTQRRWERQGTIFVQLFTPSEGGVALAASLADDVRAVLEGVTSGDLVTDAGSTNEGAEDGTWCMSVVAIPFRYYETR